MKSLKCKGLCPLQSRQRLSPLETRAQRTHQRNQVEQCKVACQKLPLTLDLKRILKRVDHPINPINDFLVEFLKFGNARPGLIEFATHRFILLNEEFC